jgi:hypothetical protein
VNGDRLSFLALKRAVGCKHDRTSRHVWNALKKRKADWLCNQKLSVIKKSSIEHNQNPKNVIIKFKGFSDVTRKEKAA